MIVTVIKESKIMKNGSPANNTNLQNCSNESCSNESSAVGSLLYVVNHIFYEPQSDLYIYKSTE